MTKYIKITFKWLVLVALMGVIGGTIGAVFHKSLDIVTHAREKNAWLICFLPFAGILITLLYSPFQKRGKLNTNRIIASVEADEDIPLAISPLIFAGTLLTHLFGGSAGREGAALQLGGSIGYNMGRKLGFEKEELRLVVMAGMSAFFSAMFGAPITAAIFSLEVIKTHNVHRKGFLPCVISSVIAYVIARFAGAEGVRYSVPVMDISLSVVAKIVILASLCAFVGILFCLTIKYVSLGMKKLFKNEYLRTIFGSIVIIALAFVLDTTDYNGAGMGVMSRAMAGNAAYEAFILKIIFTAITIAAGFKGGEIVPTLFIGSTFGCAIGSLLGLNPAFSASLGFAALFCAVVKCPIASVALAVEVFGGDGIVMYAIVCIVAFVLSGKSGIYKHKIKGDDISNEKCKAC